MTWSKIVRHGAGCQEAADLRAQRQALQAERDLALGDSAAKSQQVDELQVPQRALATAKVPYEARKKSPTKEAEETC